MMNRKEMEKLIEAVGDAAYTAGTIHGALSLLVLLQQNPELARQMIFPCW